MVRVVVLLALVLATAHAAPDGLGDLLLGPPDANRAPLRIGKECRETSCATLDSWVPTELICGLASTRPSALARVLGGPAEVAVDAIETCSACGLCGPRPRAPGVARDSQRACLASHDKVSRGLGPHDVLAAIGPDDAAACALLQAWRAWDVIAVRYLGDVLHASFVEQVAYDAPQCGCGTCASPSFFDASALDLEVPAMTIASSAAAPTTNLTDRTLGAFEAQVPIPLPLAGPVSVNVAIAGPPNTVVGASLQIGIGAPLREPPVENAGCKAAFTLLDTIDVLNTLMTTPADDGAACTIVRQAGVVDCLCQIDAFFEVGGYRWRDVVQKLSEIGCGFVDEPEPCCVAGLLPRANTTLTQMTTQFAAAPAPTPFAPYLSGDEAEECLFDIGGHFSEPDVGEPCTSAETTTPTCCGLVRHELESNPSCFCNIAEELPVLTTAREWCAGIGIDVLAPIRSCAPKEYETRPSGFAADATCTARMSDLSCGDALQATVDDCFCSVDVSTIEAARLAVRPCGPDDHVESDQLMLLTHDGWQNFGTVECQLFKDEMDVTGEYSCGDNLCQEFEGDYFLCGNAEMEACSVACELPLPTTPCSWVYDGVALTETVDRTFPDFQSCPAPSAFSPLMRKDSLTVTTDGAGAGVASVPLPAAYLRAPLPASDATEVQLAHTPAWLFGSTTTAEAEAFYDNTTVYVSGTGAGVFFTTVSVEFEGGFVGTCSEALGLGMTCTDKSWFGFDARSCGACGCEAVTTPNVDPITPGIHTYPPAFWFPAPFVSGAAEANACPVVPRDLAMACALYDVFGCGDGTGCPTTEPASAASCASVAATDRYGLGPTGIACALKTAYDAAGCTEPWTPACDATPIPYVDADLTCEDASYELAEDAAFLSDFAEAVGYEPPTTADALCAVGAATGAKAALADLDTNATRAFGRWEACCCSDKMKSACVLTAMNEASSAAAPVSMGVVPATGSYFNWLAEGTFHDTIPTTEGSAVVSIALPGINKNGYKVTCTPDCDVYTLPTWKIDRLTPFSYDLTAGFVSGPATFRRELPTRSRGYGGVGVAATLARFTPVSASYEGWLVDSVGNADARSYATFSQEAVVLITTDADAVTLAVEAYALDSAPIFTNSIEFAFDIDEHTDAATTCGNPGTRGVCTDTCEEEGATLLGSYGSARYYRASRGCAACCASPAADRPGLLSATGELEEVRISIPYAGGHPPEATIEGLPVMMGVPVVYYQTAGTNPKTYVAVQRRTVPSCDAPYTTSRVVALHAAVPPRSEFLIEGTAEYGLRIVGSATVEVNGANYTIVDSDDVFVGATDRVTFAYSGGSVASVQLLVVACDAAAPAGQFTTATPETTPAVEASPPASSSLVEQADGSLALAYPTGKLETLFTWSVNTAGQSRSGLELDFAGTAARIPYSAIASLQGDFMELDGFLATANGEAVYAYHGPADAAWTPLVAGAGFPVATGGARACSVDCGDGVDRTGAYDPTVGPAACPCNVAACLLGGVFISGPDAASPECLRTWPGLDRTRVIMEPGSYSVEGAGLQISDLPAVISISDYTPKNSDAPMLQTMAHVASFKPHGLGFAQDVTLELRFELTQADDQFTAFYFQNETDSNPTDVTDSCTQTGTSVVCSVVRRTLSLVAARTMATPSPPPPPINRAAPTLAGLAVAPSVDGDDVSFAITFPVQDAGVVAYPQVDVLAVNTAILELGGNATTCAPIEHTFSCTLADGTCPDLAAIVPAPTMTVTVPYADCGTVTPTEHGSTITLVLRTCLAFHPDDGVTAATCSSQSFRIVRETRDFSETAAISNEALPYPTLIDGVRFVSGGCPDDSKRLSVTFTLVHPTGTSAVPVEATMDQSTVLFFSESIEANAIKFLGECVSSFDAVPGVIGDTVRLDATVTIVFDHRLSSTTLSSFDVSREMFDAETIAVPPTHAFAFSLDQKGAALAANSAGDMGTFDAISEAYVTNGKQPICTGVFLEGTSSPDYAISLGVLRACFAPIVSDPADLARDGCSFADVVPNSERILIIGNEKQAVSDLYTVALYPRGAEADAAAFAAPTNGTHCTKTVICVTPEDGARDLASSDPYDRAYLVLSVTGTYGPITSSAQRDQCTSGNFSEPDITSRDGFTSTNTFAVILDPSKKLGNCTTCWDASLPGLSEDMTYLLVGGGVILLLFAALVAALYACTKRGIRNKELDKELGYRKSSTNAAARLAYRGARVADLETPLIARRNGRYASRPYAV